jgi:hypothetical protein
MRFLNKHGNREKIEELWKPQKEKDNWMDGIMKNKKRRLPVDDDALPLLNSPRCVIALLPGGAGYDEMLEKINEEDSVCSNE